MYKTEFAVPEEVIKNNDFLVPIGKAKVMREGKHCSIISYSRGV